MPIVHLPDLLAHLERPRVLELGGRRVTPAPWQPPPHWQRVGLDVLPGPGVDVVADAHALASHLEPESFDGFYTFLSAFNNIEFAARTIIVFVSDSDYEVVT